MTNRSTAAAPGSAACKACAVCRCKAIAARSTEQTARNHSIKKNIADSYDSMYLAYLAQHVLRGEWWKFACNFG
jgi:hypothetical protein